MRVLGHVERHLRELAGARRSLRLDEVGDGLRVLRQIVHPQRERHPRLGAERVDEQWKGRPRDALEQQGRTARLHDPIRDGGHFEAGVDGAADAHELSALFERANERAHALVRHRSSVQLSK